MQFGSPYSLPYMIDVNDSIIYLDTVTTRGSLFIKFTPSYSGNFLPIVDGVSYPPVYGSSDRVNLAKVRGNPRFNNHVVTMVPIGLNTSISIDPLPYQKQFEDLHPSKLTVNFTGTPRYFSLLDGGQFTNWNVTGISRFANCRGYQNIGTYGVLDLRLEPTPISPVTATSGSSSSSGSTGGTGTGGTAPDYTERTLTLSLGNYLIASGTRFGDGVINLTQENNSGVSGSVYLTYSHDLAESALFVTQFPDDYVIYIRNSPFNETNTGGTGTGGSDITAIDSLVPTAIVKDDGHTASYEYKTDDIQGGTYYVLVRERFNCVESLNDIPAVIALDITPNPPGRPTLTDGRYIVFDASTTPDVSYNIYDSVDTEVMPLSPSYTISPTPSTENQIAIDINSLASVGTSFTGYRYLNIRAVTPPTGTDLTGTEGGVGNIEDGNLQTFAIEYQGSQIISPRPVAPGVVSASACGMALNVKYFQSMATIKLDTRIINAQAYKIELFIFPENSTPDYNNPTASQILTNNVGTAINGMISGVIPASLGPGNYKYALRSVALSSTAGTTGDIDIQSDNTDTYGPLLIQEGVTPAPAFSVAISG